MNIVESITNIPSDLVEVAKEYPMKIGGVMVILAISAGVINPIIDVSYSLYDYVTSFRKEKY